MNTAGFRRVVLVARRKAKARETSPFPYPGQMQLAHVSPSGLRGGDHAFAVTPLAQESGRGLWLARQVVDLLQVVPTPTGTAVRLYVRIAA